MTTILQECVGENMKGPEILKDRRRSKNTEGSKNTTGDVSDDDRTDQKGNIAGNVHIAGT